MNILIVGLGSMGKRRMRLIKKLYPDVSLYGVDSNPNRCAEAFELFGTETYTKIDEVISKQNVDCGFVCTAPLSHHVIIDTLIKNNINVFTELNLVPDGYENIINLKDAPLVFLSSTLVYRKDLQYITEMVNSNAVNYIYHSGQYLPDWHPWENYNNFFVGDKRTNGCREIFAIELPWLTKCFGEVTSFNILKGKATSLKIDYDDNFTVMIEHESGSKGLLAVDIVARRPMRRLEVYSENLHLFWDGTPDSLSKYNIDTKTIEKIDVYNNIEKDSRYCDNIVENAYIDEIDIFLNAVKTNDCSAIKYNFEDDYEVLKLIDKFGA